MSKTESNSRVPLSFKNDMVDLVIDHKEEMKSCQSSDASH